MSTIHKYKYFLSFEAGNCVSNSSFQWMKNRNKQFSSRRVNNGHYGGIMTSGNIVKTYFLCFCFTLFKDFRGRMEFRDKACGYLTGIMSNINGSLRNCGSSGLIKHVYILAGQLVKHCAQIIYIKVRRITPCNVKRQYLLICKVSRYCLLTLQQ